MAKKRSWGRRLWLLLVFIFPLIIGELCILWGIPQLDSVYKEHGEHFADAAESTLAYYQRPQFGPEHVHLSLGLLAIAGEEGISPTDLQAIIAAAASETPRGHYYHEWVEDSYEFATLLLGLAKVETNYCRNLGQGVALEELEKRLGREPELASYWEANIRALEEIAERLRVEVEQIPGSIGAGAISCFQLMPTSWLSYGGDDYRDTYQAALNAARFLKAHGYPDNPEDAVRAYNFNAGQPYVDDVLNSSTVWEFPVTTSLITEPYPLNIRTLPLVYLEFLAWYTGDYKVGTANFVFAGEFVHPYPGSVATSYFWEQPVYDQHGQKVIDHPGQDYGGLPSSPVVSAHNGTVTFARWLCPRINDPRGCTNPDDSALAVKWWVSGNSVIIRGNAQGGQAVCTFYGHGADGTIGVSPGQQVSAGQFLMMSGTTGFSSGIHLHFAIKVGGSGNFCDGGTWVDPNQYVR